MQKSKPPSYLHLCYQMTKAGEGDPRFNRRRRHFWRKCEWKRYVTLFLLSPHSHSPAPGFIKMNNLRCRLVLTVCFRKDRTLIQYCNACTLCSDRQHVLTNRLSLCKALTNRLWSGGRDLQVVTQTAVFFICQSFVCPQEGARLKFMTGYVNH